MPSRRSSGIEASRRFIAALDPVRPPGELESGGFLSGGRRGLGAPAPVFVGDAAQAITIGSQLTEFAATVPAALRRHIANGFTLARHHADSSVERDADSIAWYQAYLDVLVNIGWNLDGEAVLERSFEGDGAEVHEAIVPVLAAALGPAVAAALLVTKVLESLAAMDADRPWITLFDRESRRSSARQFQVAHVDVPAGDAPRVTVVAFELTAEREITQVLFFRFSRDEARLRHFTSTLSANLDVFEAVTDLVSEKAAAHAADYIRALT